MFEGSPARALTLLCLLASVACTGPEPSDRADSAALPGAIEIVDAAGKRHHLDAPATRIISLVPSATLTLEALGAREALIARTDFDTARFVQSLPSVGGGIMPSHETLVALQPDLVIRFAGEQDVETPALLDRLGIRHVAIRPDRIDDILEAVHILGAVSGRDAEAAEMVSVISATLDSVRAATSGRAPVQTAYVLGGSPPWVAGPGTYVDEVIRIAGGINVFGDLTRLYAPVGPEEFVARPIDVILTPDGAELPERLQPGVRVIRVGNLLELPGVDVGRVAAEVARLLGEEDRP